ncbi:MAG: transglycosylase SLT domain-containing protein [Patescibacteria group bacterium]
MRKFLIFLVIFFIGFLPTMLRAEESACTDQIAGKSRAQLERELEACNKEITEWTETLNKTRKDSASFATDIAALTAKINAAQANIKGKNIAIANLTKDIATKQSEISVLDNRVAKGKKAIADILRKTNDINSYSLVETMFSNKNISEFFVDIDTYASTKRALADLFTELRNIRQLTEAEKATLNKKREVEAAARASLEASKKEVEISQAEKKTLLAINKTKEKTYEQVLADRQARAVQIRAALFPLRDSVAIPFGTALQYAEAARAQTGVKSSLILAILLQESNLGANVGSCVIINLTGGETKSIKSGTIFKNGIHPTRDLPPLQSILNNLGGNPLETKVSCPVSATFGYGGAMGPAQFIPSTWNLMMDRIKTAVNKTTPNPWDPHDAIMAMAIFLKDLLGTTGDPFTDQRTAACRYYSGKTCYGSNGANVGLSYGNSVMSKASTIQRDIDFLQGL